MKRKFEDKNSTLVSSISYDMIEDVYKTECNSVKTKRVGSLFQKVNYFALKYLIDTYKEPSELRKMLLRYTKLYSQYTTDIQIEFSYMSDVQIVQELGEDQQTPLKIKSSEEYQNEDNQVLQKQEEIQDEEYGNIMFKMLEVLGISIESRVKEVLEKYKLPIELINNIYQIMRIKSKYFQIMIQKTYEDFDEDKLTLSKDQVIFKSLYDETIDKAYQEYKSFFLKSESKQQIDESLSKITEIIGQVLNQLSLAELESAKNTQETQYILSFKEKNNLIQLKELFSANNEYFYETLKPLSERKFFFWKEYIRLNGDIPDKICLFNMLNLIDLNDKYSDIIKNSICALANSQGGTVYVGILNSNNQVRSKDLRDIVSYNCIEQLKKLAMSITPRVNFDIKLINVIDSFKYSVKHENTFVISLVVKSRRPTEMFYVLKNQRERCYFIRNQGINQRLMNSNEIKKLSEIRVYETDTPNLQDYLKFNSDFNPKEFLSKKNQNQLNSKDGQKLNNKSLILEDEDEQSDDDIRHFKLDFQPERKVNMQQLKPLETIQERKNIRQNTPNIQDYLQFKNEFTLKEYKSNTMQNHCNLQKSPIKNNKSQIHENKDDHKLGNNEVGRNFKLDFRFDQKNQIQQLKPFENILEGKNMRQNTQYNRRTKFQNFNRSHSKKKSNENNVTYNDNRRSFFQKGSSIPELSSFKLVPRLFQAQQRSQFFYHPQISQLDNWKKIILKEFLNQESTLNFTEFMQSSQINKLLPEFEQLKSNNCFMISKIDTQQKTQFKEAISKLKKENQIPIEYIENIYNFTILKVDREKFNAQIERLVTPIIIKYSYRNNNTQGFNFDNIEIKNVYNVIETMNILDNLFKHLGVDVDIKYTQGKLLMCFSKIQNFIYGYHIFIKIKKVFEQDQYSNKVFPHFNQPMNF